jgi:catechol 2,3-dioxygenase-like lactoylglutathione lyase family enzyme
MIAGYHHVQVAIPPGTEAEAAAERFYDGLLGFEPVAKPAELAGRGGLWFRSGGAELHLGVADPFVPATKAHPGFEVRDLRTMAARLEAAGVEVAWDPVRLDGRRSRCYVTDPFGNRLELVDG